MKRPKKYIQNLPSPIDDNGYVLCVAKTLEYYKPSDIDPLLDELERLRADKYPEKIEPIRSKRCVAYYCLQGNGLFSYKVEFKSKHLKWVDTREDAENLIKLIDP